VKAEPRGFWRPGVALAREAWLAPRAVKGEDERVTPGEKNIVRSLIAVAWADGQMELSETSVIEGLLSGFDASEAEELELLEYARVPRTLQDDIPLAALSPDERELLFANAALLTHADGVAHASERTLLDRLGELLGLEPSLQQGLLESAQAASRRGAQPRE
jgi:uncharacterized membrane protein YebE (DUF533 family)